VDIYLKRFTETSVPFQHGGFFKNMFLRCAIINIFLKVGRLFTLLTV